MDLVVYAVPLFIAAMIFELVFGIVRGRNTYRLNDAVSSLFLGTLSQARRFLVLGVGGVVYAWVAREWSLTQLDARHWFTWVFAFVAYDFCYYWLHRLGHERRILWAAHVAHHQSEDYNLSTALRQTSTGFLLGWIFYLPLFFAGVPAEVFVTVGSLNLIYQFWVHTEHVGELGWLEWIFVTPSNHRVHHAQNDRYMDRNYGGVFILWDRLFGTYQREDPNEPCIYGIRGPLRSFNPLRALTHIYVDMLRDMARASRWRDRLAILVGRTTWRPEELERLYPAAKPDLENFRKYDPRVSAGVRAYALFQLVAAVALLAVMQHSPLTYAQGALLALAMLATTVVTARWLEGNSPSAGWDALRLLLIATLGISGLFPQALASALLGYALLNALLLLMLWRASQSATGSGQPVEAAALSDSSSI